MKPFLLLSCLLFWACSMPVKGQLLTQTLQLLKSHQHASYVDVVTSKFSFQEKASVDTIKSKIAFVDTEMQTGGYYSLSGPGLIDYFDGQKHIQLYLHDSTYTLKKEAVTGQNTRTLLYYTQQLIHYLNTPEKIKLLPDTIIKHIRYNHIKFIQFDSLQKQTHVFAHIDFVVDKKTYLPVMIKEQWSGFTDDGTKMSMMETHMYYNLKFDELNFPDLSLASVPDDFKLPPARKPTAWLPAATAAPEFKLYDMLGKEVSLTSFKGKAVLLTFTWIGCPHCVGATQMLNELSARYAHSNVVFACIYPLDAKDAVINYDKRFAVKVNSYTADKSVREIYPYEGYPAFYLVNKQGKIAQSYDGFYKDLQKELTVKIDSIK